MDKGRRVLAGRYEVGDLIGRGGMAEVHIGHDTRLGRTVAIKILRSDLARDPSFLARFRREAQAAAALNHPAIVAVYDTGEDTYPDADLNTVHVPFIVMEYVEGHTVRDILRGGQAVPIDEAIEITEGVLSALEYSHHAGIVHRDIKPANVMITPTGAVKVMDFGIARAVADSAATMTQTQAVVGTAQYLSPEQARGETVDARSDLYSTGCLLFELLTGRPPFLGDSPVAVAYQHVREMPVAPSSLAPDVPEVLDRITLKALAKERTARYGSAAEFRTDLDSALRGGTVSAPMVGVAAAGMAATVVNLPMAESATQVMLPTQAQVPSEYPPGSPWQTTGATPVTGPDELPEEKKPSRRGLMWALIAVAVVALAVIVGTLLMNGEKEPNDLLTVPKLAADVTPAEADKIITDAGFVFSKVLDQQSQEPANTFLGQDPAGGVERAKGTEVTVTFAAGPQTVLVPPVAGMTQDEARKAIADKGLVAGSALDDNSPNVKKGQVTKTDPPEGESVAKGSTVNLYIATGRVSLPNLVGKSKAEAEGVLQSLGLKSSVQERESSEAPGTVLDQSPGEGDVTQGSTVRLTVAKAVVETTVTVPNVANMTQDGAIETLNGNALNPGPIKHENSDTVPPGQVIRTEPQAGQKVPEGTTVTIVISDGPAEGGGDGDGDG